MRCVHLRAPAGNPHPGLPWCKTSDIAAVSEDDIVTSDEFKVSCPACREFLNLGSRLRGAVQAQAKAHLAEVDAKLATEAEKVRSTLSETMEPEVTAPKVDWFGEETS